MPSQPLRVGVIGVGGIAQMMHLPTMAERPDRFTITGLADVGAETLAAVAGRYPAACVTNDYRELLAREDVDAVLLLASGSHRDIALAALDSGKHLFVEKPLGFSLRETEDIVHAAKSSRGVAMAGYHKRYDPAYRAAREALGKVRDLRWVDVTILHPDDGDYREHHPILPPPRGERPPVTEIDIRRGTTEAVTRGPMVSLVNESVGADAPIAHRVASFLCFQSLIHDINLVRGALGEPEKVVTYEIWQGGFAQTSVTQFPGDVRVNMTWVLLPGVKHYDETIRFIAPSTRITLGFPSPYLRNAPTPLTIERMDHGTLAVEHRTVSYHEAFTLELLHFADCIASGKKPETPFEDSLGDARWIQALADAAR